jgi:bifunctional non-homologous end joining protein LigD
MARRTAVAKLAKYRSLRDLGATSEPSGERAPRARGDSFVIQQHAARRMHYDFRLELDGVLLSWSVPKGPSLSPAERRLAVRFEGVIPEGQYGAGTVSIWDRGTWKPDGDPHEGLRRGRLTFALDGQKLHGRWHLVRTRPQGKQESWLLFKGRDEASREDLDIVESEPRSVITHRTVAQIASAAEPALAPNPAPGPSPLANLDVTALVRQLPLGFPLTNLDKVLYPEQGITKAQLVAYLAVVAEWMLPHVANRPLTLLRCPDGIGEPCFYQKKILPGSPRSIGTVEIEEEGGELVDYMKVKDLAGLVGLAQLGTLEIHTWGCHADKLDRPDVMVLDLDPDPAVEWDHVALGALEVRRRLHELGLASFVKTTGGKGLHVCLPIKRTAGWDELKAFAKAIAESMAADEPRLYTANPTKAARRGKIFVDYLRNGRGATFVAPYSPRARPGAPVAVPISWEELAHGVDPATFTTRTVPARLGSLARDPWREMAEVDQAITATLWRRL